MRKIVIGDRSVVVTHAGTEATEFGDIQRFRIEMSGSHAVTHLSILRSSAEVDARVMASVIDAELLLEHEGSAESGLLRDPGVRAWRDENRPAIDAALGQLRAEITGVTSEPMSDLERTLLRAFGMDADAHGSRDRE
ncbi:MULTISPECIES: hypothetical protein [Actinomycetes]|uniref:hypothetical protein n=1 Tax=Actinomycetes TaxID=1760 RepID=UPI002354E869|nr:MULTISPECIES: hypothetical protein [Actinomycetes]